MMGGGKKTEFRSQKAGGRHHNPEDPANPVNFPTAQEDCAKRQADSRLLRIATMPGVTRT
jgi:hypothetical protein